MTSEIYLGSPEESTVSWIKKYATPFYVEALTDGNVKLVKNGSPNEISLLYSLDNKNWSDWDYEAGTELKAGEKLYLKSKTDNGSFSSNWDSCFTFNFSADFLLEFMVRVCGNIMSLLYNNFYNKKELKNYGTFYELFNNCTTLIYASDLVLPATILTDYCYVSMFCNCTSLVSAPELPATKLDSYCYSNMFCNCKQLFLAPELPATILTEGCYKFMFYQCISLYSIPELPATSLTPYCYCYMFYGCTSIVSAQWLPATTLADSCYYSMFYDCSEITKLHYPKSLENDSTFTSMPGSPWFGATNTTVYYDL